MSTIQEQAPNVYMCGTAPQLGDTVSCNWRDGYDTATVCKIHDNGTIDLFRPYTATANFSYIGGLMCYVGVENIREVNPRSYTLLRVGKMLR